MLQLTVLSRFVRCFRPPRPHLPPSSISPQPRALEELFPDFKNMENPPPLDTEVNEDVFLYLTETGSVGIPNALLPSQLHNDGNYIISLGQLCRWLATQAEEVRLDGAKRQQHTVHQHNQQPSTRRFALRPLISARR